MIKNLASREPCFLASRENKQNIAVIFGGRSTEHEISILTGLQVIHALDSTRFKAMPVYIDQQGQWWTGSSLWQREFYESKNFDPKKLVKVALLPLPGIKGLIECRPRRFKKPKIVPVDVYFPALHGTYGEDGCIQGLFELANVPYVGPGLEAAVIGMNKVLTKQIAKQNNIAVLPYVLIDRNEWDVTKPEKTNERVLEFLSLPVFVKPCNLGSSVGISSAKDKEQLTLALAGAFVFDQQVIVEPMIKNLLEIQCSVLDGKPARVSVFEQPHSDAGLLSFEEKYLKGGKGTKLISYASQGMASTRRTIDPLSIDEQQKEQIYDWARKIFEAINGKGVARIDFLIDKDSQKIYLNEINTIPGSLAYYLWQESSPKLSFIELLTKLIELAINRHQEKNQSRLEIKRQIFR